MSGLAALGSAMDASIRRLTEERDATFDSARAQYLDMRDGGVHFPAELESELDSLFSGAGSR